MFTALLLDAATWSSTDQVLLILCTIGIGVLILLALFGAYRTRP